MRFTRVTTAVLALVAACAAVSPAQAEIGGSPADSISQAFGPLQPLTDYSGAFRSAEDIDFGSFVVDHAPETLHFDVSNTVGSCTSIYLNGCPVYATLIDGAGQQLGGEGSSAGTGPVDAGATDVIDWTFDRLGTFYVVFDSDGDLPTYRFGFAEVTAAAPPGGPGEITPPGSSAPPGGTPGSPTISALRLRSRQRGSAVTASVRVGAPLRKLKLVLSPAGGGPVLGVTRALGLATGRVPVRVALRPDAIRRLARRGRLRLRLKLTAIPAVGSPVTLAKRLTLLAPEPG